MTLRVSLVIDGNASGAKKAAEDASRSVSGLANQTKGLAAAQNDNVAANTRQSQSFRQVRGEIDKTNTSTGSMRSTFKALAREAAVVGGPLGGLIAQAGALTVGTGKLGGAITVGTVAIAAVALSVYQAVTAFGALETQQVKTAAALALTKGASGQTVGSIEALTQALAASGTQSLDDIRAAEAELLKYKAVGGDAFGAVLKSAKDVAATGFADLKTATTAIAKALQDPTKASEDLASVGLKLSVAEQRLATDLYNAGKAAEAKGVILKAVSAQAEGGDAKAADTLGAAWNRVTASGAVVLEQWGKTISEGLRLKGVLGGIASALDDVAKPRKFENNVDTIQQQVDMARRASGGIPSARDVPANVQREVIEKALRDAGIVPVGKGVSVTGQDFANMDTRGLDQAEEAWRKYGASIAAARTENSAAAKRIAEVTDALAVQTRTAGLNVVQQQIYDETRKAGVNADNEAAKAAGGLTDEQKKAAAAIGGLVHAITALKDAREITDQIKTQTAASIAEEKSLGMTGGAAAAYRLEREKLNAELIKGVALSPAQIAAVKGEAAAYGNAVDNLARLNLQKTIAFERDQLGRSTSEQEVYSRLQAAGMLENGQIASTAAEGAAAQIRLNQTLKTTIDLTTEVTSGFAKDFKNAIRDGASAFDALKTAGTNALDRVSDKLIDMATQNLVAKALGGSSGGGLLSLFGLGGGATSTAGGISSNVGGGYAGGGIIIGPGSGTSDSIVARVSRGEFVVNADATAKHRAVLEAINSGTIRRFADGGFAGSMPPPRWSSGTSSSQAASPVVKIYPVAGTTFDEKRNDDGSVELVGRMIDQKLKNYDRGLPDRVAAIRRDPRAR